MIHKFTLLEGILLRANVIPHPLIDAMTYVLAGRALQVSIKIGLIEILQDQDLSLDQLAKKLKLPEDSIAVLVDNLEALGYLSSLKNNKYSLSKRGEKFFSKDSKSSMKNTILFSSYVFEALGDLEKNIKTGGPKNVNLDIFTPKQWDIFNNTMIEIASSNAVEIAKLLPKSRSFKKLLDVGGSHGIHAIEYCKKIPDLTATIFDLKPVEPYANRIIKEQKMSDRVSFKVGNFFSDNLGKNYDVVFAFNIIHGLNPKQNDVLTKKIYDALNPGGMYVILDQIKEARGNSQLSQLVSAAQGLLLFNQAGGKTYSYVDVKGCLETVGFSNIKMKKLRAPGNALIYGFK